MLTKDTHLKLLLKTFQGRVAAKYSRILSTCLESGKIVRDYAVFTGNITDDGPNIGGGPKLICMYFLDIVENHYYPVMNDLSAIDGAIYIGQTEDLPS